jgi:DNA mismatch repair protein MutL
MDVASQGPTSVDISPPPTPPPEPRRIRTLPVLVANQIAAGEVVERPASVVKELVENALDAGATRIRVELEQGGVELIRIVDDGSGMEPEDLPLAIAPHATSKIRETTDLDSIATLGFRGEALASIASVSRMTIRSRTKQAAGGGASELELEGDRQQPIRPAAGAIGTSITVRNLFFNTPARRKFLRTPQTEKERCADVFEQLAMAHPGVGFMLMVDGRVVHDLPALQGPRERVVAILGRELESQLIGVSADQFDDARGVALWGMIGLPSLARGSTKGQYVFVNGRAVKDRTIQHAIAEAYRGIIEPGRHPTVVLMLELSPQGVDVNVHPQKAEVRFRDSSLVHGVVLRAIRESLQRADLTPTALSLRPALGWSAASGTLQPALLGAISPNLAGLPLAGVDEGSRKIASFFSKYRPGDELAIPGSSIAPSTMGMEQVEAKPAQGGAGQQSSSAWTEAQPAAPSRSGAAIVQVHNSYVVTPDEDGVVIIDQHALHERAMFEFLTQRILAGNLESQQLLAPVPIGVSPAQAGLLDVLRPLMTRIGVEADLLSPVSLGVRAFPSFLFERGVDIEEFMPELLRAAEAGELGPDVKVAGEHALREVLDMMSCKAAVKAGDKLSGMELTQLLQLREDVERSSNCPHGRPTSVRITLREIEKLFGRA